MTGIEALKLILKHNKKLCHPNNKDYVCVDYYYYNKQDDCVMQVRKDGSTEKTPLSRFLQVESGWEVCNENVTFLQLFDKLKPNINYAKFKKEGNDTIFTIDVEGNLVASIFGRSYYSHKLYKDFVNATFVVYDY